MLTTDLVRARVIDGVVCPSYIKPHAARMVGHAEEMLALFQGQIGGTQGSLDEALADQLSEGGDVKIRRGIAKLLRDRCTFEPAWDHDPRALRQELFVEAGRRHPVGTRGDCSDRDEVFRRIATRHGIAADELEVGLYADLKEAHRLTCFRELSAHDLLLRYNVALAQGVLLRATQVRIELTRSTAARYRQLFRFVKFYQLSFTAEPIAGGYRIELDGPLSLFRLVQRYGLRLAQFLPALLLHEDGWTLEADVSWQEGRGRVAFHLSPEDGLRSHYRDTGVWIAEEQRWFAERFRKRKTQWSLVAARRVVSLGGKDVFVPDFILRHADGREALLEIVWSWRRSGLARHLRYLAAHGPDNLVLAVSDRLRVGQDDARTLPDAVVRFKQVLRPNLVEKAAARVARRPDGRGRVS